MTVYSVADKWIIHNGHMHGQTPDAEIIINRNSCAYVVPTIHQHASIYACAETGNTCVPSHFIRVWAKSLCTWPLDCSCLSSAFERWKYRQRLQIYAWSIEHELVSQCKTWRQPPYLPLYREGEGRVREEREGKREARKDWTKKRRHWAGPLHISLRTAQCQVEYTIRIRNREGISGKDKA